jgi:hypothetical protein
MPNVPILPYEVNWHLVTGNGSLTPICSLSPSLTVLSKKQKITYISTLNEVFNKKVKKN